MKKCGLAAIILLAFVIACSVQQGKVVQKYSIEQFYQNRNIFGGSFSPDESRLLVTSNETGIYNVFALPVDGSAPQQLTSSEK